MGKISSVRDRISQAPDWSVCVWEPPEGKQKSPAVLEQGEGRQDARSDAAIPAGRGLRAASRKPSVIPKPARDPAPHQDRGHHPELNRELSCLGEEKTFPILCCSDFFSRASHPSWPRRHHTPGDTYPVKLWWWWQPWQQPREGGTARSVSPLHREGTKTFPFCAPGTLIPLAQKSHTGLRKPFPDASS